MLLHSLTVENYKGFGSSQTIEFAEPTKGSGLTVIVGPNNSGKSTILKTIRQLVSQDDVFVAGSDDRRSAPLKIMLSGEVQGGAFTIVVNGRGSAARLKKAGRWDSRVGDDLIYVPARRPWSDKFNAHPFGGNAKKEHDNGLYTNSRQQEFYVDASFGAAMAQIEIDEAAKKEYTAILQRLEPTISEWTIDNRDTDFISFKSVSGASHRIGLVGEGVTNIFRLAYALYDFKEGNVLLLDEPELSLHPQAQRHLYEEILQRSSLGQVVVSTHSPYFVSWSDIQAGGVIYRANLIENDGTSLSTIAKETVVEIAKVADEKKNRKLYDVVAKEIFFSRGTLFVEGQEDAHIILEYLQLTGRPNIEVFGYGAGGASHIVRWVRVARQLGIKAAALFDGDREGAAAFEKCRLEFSKDKLVFLRKLPTDDIRDKSEKKAVGIFDDQWRIKPGYQVTWDTLLEEFAEFLRD